MGQRVESIFDMISSGHDLLFDGSDAMPEGYRQGICTMQDGSQAVNGCWTEEQRAKIRAAGFYLEWIDEDWSDTP